MTKAELKLVVDELRAGKTYVDTGNVEAVGDVTAPLEGLGLSDFEKGKLVRKEAVIHFLRWQTLRMDGTIDEEELSECLGLLSKKVVMV